MDKLLRHSVPQFPHLSNRTHPVGVWCPFSELHRSPQNGAGVSEGYPFLFSEIRAAKSNGPDTSRGALLGQGGRQPAVDVPFQEMVVLRLQHEGLWLDTESKGRPVLWDL